MSGSDLPRRDQSLVAVGRWHADVDDRHVRRIVRDERDEVRCGADRADHVDALLRPQAGEAFSDEEGVFGDDHAHGIAASTRVPRPGGLSITRCPSSASTRSRNPLIPVPAVSAPPIPSSVTTFARASEATKYAVDSTGAGTRSPHAVT